MVTPFRFVDLATQPRFLLPVLFPLMVYLGWRKERIGRLRNQMFATLAIDVFGFLLATAIEAQPISAELINSLQGVALVVVAATIYGVWEWRGWSSFVRGWALVATLSVIIWLPARTLLTLSGGVLIPTASFVYLTLEDRRLAPLLGISVFRIVVAVTREGFTPIDVLVALGLAMVAVLLVRGVWPQTDSSLGGMTTNG